MPPQQKPFEVRELDLSDCQDPRAGLEELINSFIAEGFDIVTVVNANNTYTLYGDEYSSRDYNYAERHILVIGKKKTQRKKQP